MLLPVRLTSAELEPGRLERGQERWFGAGVGHHQVHVAHPASDAAHRLSALQS